MGGRSFGFAGHLEEQRFENPTSGDLSLTLWTPPAIEFMQQLEGDIRLRNNGATEEAVHSSLSLASDGMDLLIRRPNDRFPKKYRHFYTRCVRDPLRKLQPGEAIYQEISPSFGLRHWFLDDPGTYELQAVYRAPTGQKLASDIRRVRVTYPSKEADQEAADFFTTDTGTYLGIEGSRSPTLQKVKELLKELSEKLPNAGISRQIRVIDSLCDTRIFKDVQNRKIKMPDRTKTTVNLMKALRVNLSKQTIKRDDDQSNIRLTRILQTAVGAFASVDERDKARGTLGTIKKMLTAVKAPKQAKEELATFQQKIGL
jgi:hypothetical protein